ncbi:HRDC domain-containing protein [Buchananella felis]|uniref:ribonuclease D n=1 Tax=Buchananella felis TaxID=3231492 RepID=UPI003527ED83
MSNPLEILPLTEPREGIPALITTQKELEECAAALKEGTGPVAIDTERAAGFKYHQRAYLVQLRREGSGSFLIDPTHFDGLGLIAQALQGVEWILHAADQDMPCLALEGLYPAKLFDTALAARILGYERIGLGPLIEDEFGLALAKEHSAADWSQRPLPPSFLAYAALDVELLIELRERQLAALEKTGKLEWALEEFEHLRTAPPAPPKPDPWRRVPQANKVRSRRGLAILREVWSVREDMAAAVDLTPGRLIPHHSLIAIAESEAKTAADVLSLKACRNGRVKENLDFIVAALEAAWAIPEEDLPATRAPSLPGGVGDPRNWKRHSPAATEMYDALRAAILERAEFLHLPQEILLRPQLQRVLAWRCHEKRQAGGDLSAEAIAELIGAIGGRAWQAAMLAPELADVLAGATFSDAK